MHMERCWICWLLEECNREGNGNPLQYSCLENPMDRGAWWAAVHGVAKSRTWLSDFTFTFHFHALEEEMATHSSVLAWRIPGMGEPGGLPSLGSHRVRHDWSDLAAAAEECKSKPQWVVDLTPARMPIIKKSTNNKCWRRCGEKGTLLHCWWERKLVQPLWRIEWRFLKKLKIELPYHPEIPLLYPEKTIIQKDKCTPMCTALFTIAKTWK